METAPRPGSLSPHAYPTRASADYSVYFVEIVEDFSAYSIPREACSTLMPVFLKRSAAEARQGFDICFTTETPSCSFVVRIWIECD